MHDLNRGWIRERFFTTKFVPLFLILGGYALAETTVTPAEIYARTRSVLEHLKLPEEGSPQTEFDSLQGKVSASELLTMIRALEFKDKVSDHYWKIQTDSRGDSDWIVYRDADSFHEEDFRVRLAPPAFSPKVNLPRTMAGLRIAFDPGHMGTPDWDKRGGKYVKDSKGRYLSEGLLVLELSYLLKDRFEKRGAETVFTRYVPGTVAGDFSKFDATPYIQEKIAESVDLPWFLKIVNTYAIGAKLWDAVSKSADYKSIVGYPKDQYYINGPDLDERSRIINEAAPDIALILHMDTNGPDSNPSGIGSAREETKAYVAGGFMATEFSTRGERANFAQIALHPEVWNASVALGKSIVDQIHNRLALKYDTPNTSNSRGVVQGVMARNLRVQRKIPSVVSAYMESLFYSDPKEFERLLDYKYEMTIDGKKYPYSQRLVDLADAIEAGVVSYIESRP